MYKALIEVKEMKTYTQISKMCVKLDNDGIRNIILSSVKLSTVGPNFKLPLNKHRIILTHKHYTI